MKRNSILKKIYNPKIPLAEIVAFSEEYNKQSKIAIEKEEELREKLKEKGLLELYEKATAEFDFLHSISWQDNYMEGFRMGMLLAMDIFNIDTLS